MNAYELADQVQMWGEDLLALNMKGGVPVTEGAKLIRQQADRLGVLEANHDIQKEINQKALQYISELEKGLRSSLDLNKAQAGRQAKQLDMAEFLPIWKDYIKDVDGVMNVQLVAHHFYNLGAQGTK